MHSLPGMILLYLAAPFYTEGVFALDIITFVRFTYCYKSRIFETHMLLPTLVEVDQNILWPVHSLPWTIELA